MSTTHEMYQQMFLKIMEREQIHWDFLFTDGSKTNLGSAFAVVDHEGKTISKGLLEEFSSVLSAETMGILRALEISGNNKVIICTDSLSTLEAIKNTETDLQ